ncbi:hypothetical protein EUA76_02530 [TM7 phylum sp. oral taxon 350]|nr:hypothetical protein EUA76_02530 [TM7 phylum sp. oral taxon 350]
MDNNKILIVTPINDGEATQIAKILKNENIKTLITKQGWGASWNNLEPEIKKEIENYKNKNFKIYGVELQGEAPEGAKNIDHHRYDGDDRSNEKSSLEQVAKLIDHELTLFEQFVSANDKGFIPKMLELAKTKNLSKEQTQKMIEKVRLQDRAAQGITPEQEKIAEKAIQEAEVSDSLTVIRMSHSKTATVCDRLYGKYKNLLVLSEDGEVNFFGCREVIKKLSGLVKGSWSGGDLDHDNGFWGGYPQNLDIEKEVKNLLNI